jgi:hypothetical protein
MNYIFVYFLPGSAGNFVSRCLNLLDNAHCFVDKNNLTLPQTVAEKSKLLSYESINKQKFGTRTWTQFEVEVLHYSSLQAHWDLPKNSYSIWFSHPESKQHESLAGQDDIIYKFYIDSSDCFEWGIMNALYKNSYLDIKWFINGNDLKNNNDVHKVNLKNIISGQASFLIEFAKVCNIIGHTLADHEVSALKDLYDQWTLTTLKEVDIPEFKKNIGFLMQSV